MTRRRDGARDQKIAFFTHSPRMYGANRSLLTLVEGLRRRGCEVCVFVAGRGGMIEALEERSVECAVVPFRRWMVQSRWKAPFRLMANLLLVPYLIWQLRRREVGVVYSNSSVFPIGAWAAAASGRPHVWHIREFGERDFDLEYDLGRDAFEAWLGRAEHVIAVSEAVRDVVVEGVRDDCTVIYNGVVSRTRLEKLPTPRVSERRRDLLMVGRLEEAKGQADAIEALSLILEEEPETRLVLAGHGNESYRKSLQDLATTLEVDHRVVMAGYVEDPFELYTSSYALLVCSRCEAMGRVTAEAMAAGLPVIGRASGATRELIAHGRTGLLYNESVRDLADRSVALLQDEQLWSRIAGNARRTAEKRFTNEMYVGRVEAVLDQLRRNADNGTTTNVRRNDDSVGR